MQEANGRKKKKRIISPSHKCTIYKNTLYILSARRFVISYNAGSSQCSRRRSFLFELVAAVWNRRTSSSITASHPAHPLGKFPPLRILPFRIETTLRSEMIAHDSKLNQLRVLIRPFIQDCVEYESLEVLSTFRTGISVAGIVAIESKNEKPN